MAVKIEEKEAIDHCIKELLESVNIKGELLGPRLLFSAIKRYLKDPTKYRRNIYRDLYDELAEEFHIRNTSVEKDIRTTIENAWTKGIPEVQYELYGATVSKRTTRPTASAFIRKSAEIIRNRLG